MTGREFFSRFPELYPFLLQQLESVASTVDSETGEPDRHPSMFLLLLVLERLYPSPMDGTSSALSLAPFVPFIIRCGRSPIYRSREMAARALVPFITIDQIPSTLRALLDSLPSSTDQCFRQNHIHGTLLQYKIVKPKMFKLSKTGIVLDGSHLVTCVYCLFYAQKIQFQMEKQKHEMMLMLYDNIIYELYILKTMLQLAYTVLPFHLPDSNVFQYNVE
ncbi:hypothetical protein STEG23_019804, partial [Scotinomys teguina]